MRNNTFPAARRKSQANGNSLDRSTVGPSAARVQTGHLSPTTPPSLPLPHIASLSPPVPLPLPDLPAISFIQS
ncbi:hypothetical protein E2C01_046166 [Portunus trituberculatus]|uniref:Uncharacterized protein n=1 Tax=Portunus trituberculatus TaxID=210409 RepID=A0A5B7G081_PORTR|nr:hypothetical protein [Portunus trituberculatus]